MALRPLDPSIVNAYQAPKFNMPDPLQDVAALEQIKNSRVSRQVEEQKLAQMQRDSLALDEMQKRIIEAGGPSNLKMAFTEMINSKIPKFAEIGYAGLQRIIDKEEYIATMRGGRPTLPSAEMPTTTTAPVQGPVMSMQTLSGGNTGIKMRSNLPEQAPATTNALLESSGLPSNFSSNVLADISELERQREGLIMTGNPRYQTMVTELSRQIAELRRPQIFSPGQTVVIPGKAPFTLPAASQRPMGLSPGEVMVDPSTGQVIAKGAAREAPAPAPLERAFDTKTNSQVFVDRSQIRADPERYKPLGAEEKLRNIPETINKGLTGNVASISQIDRAIDAVTKNPNAVGLKGNLPQTILNKADPAGVEARALVTDVGSAKVHDRSGAAVAASEAPRLMPFIPQATDDAATVVKKLKQLKTQIEIEQSGILDFYSQEQGYKPSLYHRQQSTSVAPAGATPATRPSAAKPAARNSGGVDLSNPLLK